MGCDVEKMYLDLSQLLQDICKFLSGDKLGKLSPKDQQLAESLINRSKKQLQEIAKIQEEPNEDYVIMSNQVHIEDEDKCDIYSSVDDVSLKAEIPSFQDENYNPYADLPAKEASDDIKCGILSMKRRILLGFEMMKRVYGTIHDGWLLIYYSEKDLKPLHTFNLNNYEAKESDGEGSNFSIVNTQGGGKVYHFTALTHKDMLQWAIHINKNETFRNRVITISNKPQEIIMEKGSQIKLNDQSTGSLSDEDAIYEELTNVKEPRLRHQENIQAFKNTKSQMSIKKPPLPPSRAPPKKPKVPIKVSPPVIKTKSISPHNSSEDSLISYQEISAPQSINTEVPKSNSNSTKSFEDSFSDDSGDSTYETFANIQTIVAQRGDHNSNFKNKSEYVPVSRVND